MLLHKSIARYDTPVDKRFEIVFLSQHIMESQLDEAVKCAKSTVKYWLNRCKESKDLSDMKRSRRSRTTIENVDQRISRLADNDRVATIGDIQHVLKWQNIRISHEIIRRRLKEAETKFSLPPTPKPLLTKKPSI